MNNMHNVIEDYNGIIIMGDRKYIFTVATENDLDRLAQIYAEITVDYSNYKEKLDCENESDFSKVGGMFIVLNREEIEQEIKNEKNMWAVIKDSEGSILGSFWFSKENPYFNGTVYQNMDRIIYPREIITIKKLNTKYIGRLLYYTIVSAMQRNGYNCGICDVYKVKEYEADGVRKKKDLLNLPSFKLLEAIGAEFKGRNAIRKIELNKLSVWIEPQIFYLDHEVVIRKCKSFFDNIGIEIIWRR